METFDWNNIVELIHEFISNVALRTQKQLNNLKLGVVHKRRNAILDNLSPLTLFISKALVLLSPNP